MAFYNASLVGSGGSGSAFASPLGKLVANGVVSESTLPYDFRYGSAVVYNNEIHILGNYSSGSQTYHYKWNGSSWTSVSTLPYNFFYSSAVVYNGEIHILGNSNSSSTESQYHYKWNGSSWSNEGDLPYMLNHGRAVVYNKFIHILGSDQSDCQTNHYSLKNGTFLIGYAKKDSEIFYPISSTPITDNLEATTDGYKVTADGKVEIMNL